MFIIVFFLIYGAGRAIGLLALSLTMGRDVLFEEREGKQQLISSAWFLLSLLIAGVICFSLTDWGLGLPH